MVRLTFVESDGTLRELEAAAGISVMEAAKANAVIGIDGDCGGACACATCHVYIDVAWRERIGHASATEADMLDFAFDIRPESRLSCQIRLTDDVEGLVVHVPVRQF